MRTAHVCCLPSGEGGGLGAAAPTPSAPFPPRTHRAFGQVGQGDAKEPPPGSADQQGGDEDPCGHREAVGPAGQEEIHQREHAQRHGVVGT